MKHLRKYNESLEETLQDVRDILLELEDNGFVIKFSNMKQIAKPFVNVFKISIKSSKAMDFEYDDVKEALLRLSDYLDDKLAFIDVLIPLNQYGSYKKFEVTSFTEDYLKCKDDERYYDFTDQEIMEIEILLKYEHLKKYNESVEEKSFEDIKDICLELKDNGYEVSYYIFSSHKKMSIRIDNPRGKIVYDDIKDVLLRLDDYLGDNYIDTDYIGNYVNVHFETIGIIGLEKKR